MELDEDTSQGDFQNVSFKCILMSHIGKRKVNSEFKCDANFFSQDLISETVNYMSLATCTGDVQRIIRWLQSIYGQDGTKSGLIKSIASRDAQTMSSRTARTFLSAMIAVDCLCEFPREKLEALFERLSIADVKLLPRPKTPLTLGQEANVANFKIAAFGQLELPSGFISKWLGEFKGASEEILEVLTILSECKFDRTNDTALKATLERMLLRNASNACLTIRQLRLLPLVVDQLLPLLSSETDTVRLAALEAFLANDCLPAATKKLVDAFNAKGCSLKVKSSLANAMEHCTESKEIKELARMVVAKEANEQIVAKLLPLIADEPPSYVQFKSGKLTMKSVLVQHMPSSVVKEYGVQIFDLVQKEVSSSTPESIHFVCVALSKLASEAFDWSKFIKEADSKPNSFLRQLSAYSAESQCQVIDWLLCDSLPKFEQTATKYLTQLAISGHPLARKHLNIKLSSMKTHNLNLETVSLNLDESLNSWKFCKSLIKSEADAVALFDACHKLNHDWVCLASRVTSNISQMVQGNFKALFKPFDLSISALKALECFAGDLLSQEIKAFVEDSLNQLVSFPNEEQIWDHKDESTLAIPFVKAAGGNVKPDPKAEKIQAEAALEAEKGARERIKKNLALLEVAARIAPHSSACEGFGARVSKYISSSIYSPVMCKLLYGLGKAWRPLVASSLIRHVCGDASTFIDRNWNIASMSGMEDSIKRLFVQTKPLEPATLYFIPLFIIWVRNEQFDFIRPTADRLEELCAIDDLKMIKGERLDLVKALLSFESRTPDVDKIMSYVGGPIESECEANAFIEALFSESIQSRKTALEALHNVWTFSLPSELNKKFALLINLLKYDDACMQTATAVSLKFSDMIAGEQKDEEQLARDVCMLFEAKPADSWVTEAAKEYVASMSAPTSIKVLLDIYSRLLKERRPEIVNVRSKDLDLTKVSRSLVVETIGMITLPEDVDAVQSLFKHLVTELFFDPSKECYETALQSALALIESIPAEKMERSYGSQLGNLFESFLSGRLVCPNPSVTVEETDRARVFVIILLGKVSQFMADDEERRRTLVKTMLETLKTPAENVQLAVAEALVPLFSSRSHQKETLQWIGPLKTTLLQTDVSMAGRRGAAYGLAALTKARGLLGVKEWGLMDLLLSPLRANVPKSEPKPTTEAKEGALFGLELLARFLGQAFEPYVMRTIDAVLVGFSDGRPEVREATFDTARALMGCVSSAGARLLLPALLSRATLEDSNWRSRVGVLEWLGAMASMAPSVLATRLPDIIPVLIETGLNDSHGQVQAAAKKSLIGYGKAVANPEMRSLVPNILDALADPSASTGNCFRKILDTRFSHVIDGPSLALLEPLLRRALTDRSAGAATLKKLSGQIIGNLATSLVDAADFSPYLGTLIPALCGCLGDPVPQVRAHAAKVIGMLVKVAELDGRKSSLAVVSGLFPQLETQLLTSNETNSNDIDRAGAGQALAEIMAAKGIDFTCQVLKDQIAPFLSDSGSIKKEGGLLILGYLPAAFDFYERLDALYSETTMPSLITAVLDLTADQAESVRNSASKTSKALIEQFVAAGIDRSGIFARLLEGFGSSKWRVRLTCLGVLEKAMTSYDQQAEADSDDEADNVIKVARLPTAEELESSGLMDRSTIQMLQTRLYLARFDPASSQLRSIALNLWKGLSYHSPRTLTEILPLLAKEVAKPEAIEENSEQVQRALDDLFTKLGDRLIIPFLTETLHLWVLEDEELSKASLLNNLIILVRVMGEKPELLTRNNFDEANKKIVQAIMLGLQVEEEEVCHYASKLFDALLDEVLTSPEQSAPIIKQIVKSESFSDDAILMLVEYKPVQMLSVLIPTIMESLPEDEDKLRLLGDVFECAGYDAVTHAIPVVKTLLAKYAGDIGSETLDETLTSILASLNDNDDDDDSDYDSEDEDSSDEDDDHETYEQQDTVYHLRFGQFLESLIENPSAVPWAYHLVNLYCEGNPSIDHSRMYPIWIPRLLTCCLSASAETRSDAEQAKPALLSLLDSPKAQHLGGLIQAMRAPTSRLERAKISPFTAWHTPIFTQVTKMVILPILTGASSIISTDTEMLRTHACEVVSSLLRLSSTSSATASWGTSALTLLTGALIRVASDRKAGDSRTSTIETLYEAIKTHPTALRPFFPQLQRLLAQVITNSQSDSDDLVTPAVQALAKLIPLLPKPETLIQEWAAILAVSEDGDESDDNIQRVTPHSKVAMLKCLTLLFTANPETSSKVLHLKAPLNELLKMLAAHKEEAVRYQNIHFIEAVAAAGLINPEERSNLLELARMLK